MYWEGRIICFLPSVKSVVASHVKSSKLYIMKIGHVVNVEQAAIFNQLFVFHKLAQKKNASILKCRQFFN
jgi:hypothetical protein